MKNLTLISVFALLLFTKQSFCQQTLKGDTSLRNTVTIEGIIVPTELVTHVFENNHKNNLISNRNKIIYLSVGCCCFYPPCNCNGKNPAPFIFGIDSKDLIKTGKSKNKTNAGVEVTIFYIKKGALLQTPVITFNGKRIAEATFKNGSGAGNSGQTGQGSSVAEKTVIEWLVSAFKAGWWVGTQLDQTFGWSDSLSDWAIKHFHPRR